MPTLSLIIGIGATGAARHFGDRIDGSKPDTGTPLDILLRYNQNTLEQVVMFAGTSAMALALMPETAAKILPAMSLWFGLMRIAFYVGYRRRPVLRAFGFAGTFHPTVVLFIASLGVLIIAHF